MYKHHESRYDRTTRKHRYNSYMRLVNNIKQWIRSNHEADRMYIIQLPFSNINLINDIIVQFKLKT